MNTQSLKVINKYLSLPPIQAIFNKHKVAFVFVGGSRATKFYNEQSDYDLNFVVIDDCDYERSIESNYYLVDDHMLHHYILPLDAISKSGFGYAGLLIKCAVLNWDNIVWFESRYINFINTYLSLSSEMGWIGTKKFVNTAVPFSHHKSFYSLLIAANLFLGSNYSDDYIWYYKNNHNKLNNKQTAQYEQNFNTIINQIKQTEGSWEELWAPIYEKLKQTL